MKLEEMALKAAINGDRILETFTKAGVAFVGYNASNHWTGALTALISLQLAKGGNLAGGIAGTGVLALLGLTNVINQRDFSNLPSDHQYWKWFTFEQDPNYQDPVSFNP